MPLCRGTAMVGYVVTLSLFRAAGLEVTASIPPGKQVCHPSEAKAQTMNRGGGDEERSAVRDWLSWLKARELTHCRFLQH